MSTYSNSSVTPSNTPNPSNTSASNQTSHNNLANKPTITTQIISEDADFERNLLSLAGYTKIKNIADTLQGSIFVAKNLNSNNTIYKTVVIKRTSKILHKNGITIRNNKAYNIEENIMKEFQILKYLTNNSKYKCPTICQYIDFFESENNYYLVVEDCGRGLFEFVLESHQLIKQNKLRIDEWRKCVKYLFYQILIAINYLHQMNTCHLDISLENLTIQNSKWIRQKDGYLRVNPHITIKMIDFGLAELFNGGFICNKYVGKTQYMSPEIYNKQMYDPRLADMYSLGVVLFCMSTGNFPYNKPCDQDYHFKNYIKPGFIWKLVFGMNKHSYISANLLNLIKGMMNVHPSQRYMCKDVISHPWLSCYINKIN